MTRGRRHTYAIAATKSKTKSWATTFVFVCSPVPATYAYKGQLQRLKGLKPHSQGSLDHSSPIKGMYRLLDLIMEQGSSGPGNHLSLDY